MYKKVDSSMDFCSREQDVLKFWNENKIFEKSVDKNEGKELFTFYDGPPTANGKPHIGHILTRVMKDIIPRYKTMKGYQVLRKAGWDTHGLPVELEVEKLLGIDGKGDIEKYGIEPFIKKCKESVWKYQGEWERMSDRVGYWVDMESPYVTYDDNYIESIWWALKKIADKNLMYKGHKIVPYCPRCGTSLSSHEVAQGYKNVKEKSIFVKFPIKGAEGEYFLVWTTTPWTLSSNVALCMNPNENYVKIKANDEIYVVAEALVSSHFEEFEVIDTKKGIEYEGVEYTPLYNLNDTKLKAYYVTCDTYVTLSDGSGIVHIAPAFGEDDANVGRNYKLPFLQMVDTAGKFVEAVGELGGMFCKDGDKHVIADLAKRGLLFKELMYEHSYPFCWRCDTPLIYYARSSWFIKMTAVRESLLKNNASVNWLPPAIGSGRMGNFLENVIDWGVSRERYWGTPLPVWICDECDHTHFIGSKEELRERGGLTSDIELHRPYIDEVTIKCDKCGKTMHRTTEVIDCWFDSGSMPFAQWHYPFENKELFESQFPADFISEAVDQTRGWFYTLLAISTLLFDRAPFKNCIVLGHVNDKNGIKMSKHKGNVVDPWSVLDKQGADAVRWYFYNSSAPWLPSRFSPDNVSEGQRKFMGTLWNTYAFYVLYANIDGFNPTEHNIDDCKLSIMDKWIMSKLQTLVSSIDSDLNDYKITEASRDIAEFTDGLSNWYVRRCRDRFWGSEMTEDKIAAYQTLYTVLVTLSKVSAPFVPFVTEAIYSNLVKSFEESAPISIHLCDYPVADGKYIDKALETDMDFAIKAVELGRSCRNTSNMKNRQPLAKLYIKADKTLNDNGTLEIISGELNIKESCIIDDNSSFVGYALKPQLKTIGPKYGKIIGDIRAYLSSVDANAVVVDLDTKGSHTADIKGTVIDFTRDDLLISTTSKAGLFSESNGGMTVTIDTNLSPELIREGVARELTSKLQTMRKEAGFEVTDHIEVGYIAVGEALQVLANDSSITHDVLCDKIGAGEIDGYSKDWDINGDKVTLFVKKI